MSDKRTKSCTFALLLQRRFAGGFTRKSFWKLRCKKTTEHVEDFFVFLMKILLDCTEQMKLINLKGSTVEKKLVYLKKKKQMKH